MRTFVARRGSPSRPAPGSATHHWQRISVRPVVVIALMWVSWEVFSGSARATKPHLAPRARPRPGRSSAQPRSKTGPMARHALRRLHAPRVIAGTASVVVTWALAGVLVLNSGVSSAEPWPWNQQQINGSAEVGDLSPAEEPVVEFSADATPVATLEGNEPSGESPTPSPTEEPEKCKETPTPGIERESPSPTATEPEPSPSATETATETPSPSATPSETRRHGNVNPAS